MVNTDARVLHSFNYMAGTSASLYEIVLDNAVLLQLPQISNFTIQLLQTQDFILPNGRYHRKESTIVLMITEINVDCGAQLVGQSALTKSVELKYPDPVIDGNIDLTPTFEYTAAVLRDYDPSEYCPPIDCTHRSYPDEEAFLSINQFPDYLSIEQNMIILDDRAV